jgi:hypothetical protein
MYMTIKNILGATFRHDNTFDKPLPPEPPGWTKARKVEKARDRARLFLGAHGCRTSRIDGDRSLFICFRYASACSLTAAPNQSAN